MIFFFSRAVTLTYSINFFLNDAFLRKQDAQIAAAIASLSTPVNRVNVLIDLYQLHFESFPFVIRILTYHLELISDGETTLLSTMYIKHGIFDALHSILSGEATADVLVCFVFRLCTVSFFFRFPRLALSNPASEYNQHRNNSLKIRKSEG